MTNPNDPINTTGGAYTDANQNTHAGIGLTKREYFAAMLMPQIIRSEVTNYAGMTTAARISVTAADALIAELNKEQS